MASMTPPPDGPAAEYGSVLTQFAQQTSVVTVGRGSYEAVMDRSWWIIDGPNGGYVAAIVLRAIITEVADPSRRPRTLSLQYLRAPKAGPVRVEVVVERSGRSVSNVSARMTQDGRALVIAMAVLAAERPAPVSFDEGPGLPTMPDGSPVPMPEDVPRVEVDPDRDVPMRRHYDLRWVIGDLPFHPAGSTVRTAKVGGWLRPAEREPVDEVVLAAMSDAWMPPIFSRIDHPLAVPTIDLTVHFRGLPSDPLDHCFVLFESPLASGGYLTEHGRLMDRAGRLLAESRQLAIVS